MGKWRTKARQGLWVYVQGQRRPRRFRWRIWLRVLWLLLKLWWREDVSWRWLWAIPRPLTVAAVGLGVPVLILWGGTSNLDLIGNVVARAKATTLTAMEWREFVYLSVLVIGLPAAFILWAFRDHNVKATLENQRKDVNLKAFQEIQLRAAGALDSDLPDATRDTLQIAALHQLRAFLRGKFGEDFRRPAFELLLAIQQNIGERLDWASVRKTAGASEPMRRAIMSLRDRMTNAEQSATQVISSEWRAIWRSGFPLNNRKLDLADVPYGAILSGLRLNGAHLGGANLIMAHLEGADLSRVHLEGANLCFAYLEGADLSGVHLEGATLIMAQLEGADLSGAHLDGADLSGAIFDDDTRLAGWWDSLPPEHKRAEQQRLRDLGARHVNDPEQDDEESEGDEDAVP